MENFAFILNIGTLIIDILTCMVTSIILIIIIHYICYNRLKQKDKVVTCLCVTTYPVIFLFVAIAVLFHIQTLLGDLNVQNFNLTWCIFIGYISFILLNMFYWAFINQAFFRLARIVYPTYNYFQCYWLYIILLSTELIFSFILLSPILFWHGIVYLPKNYYCYVKFTDSRSILWIVFIIYGIPFLLLSLIYLRITMFLHRKLNNQALAVKQHQQRDLIVFRRILITMSLLVIHGIPPIVFLIISEITGEESSLSFRIMWPFTSLTMMGSSLWLVVITPQLKKVILKKFENRRVMPFGGI